MTPTELFSKIEARLGFVPPFFRPAETDMAVLENLWRQTEASYLDNPLPTLFKEKLAALLGRYCEVPYCLICHTCSLHPLGMGGAEVVALLTQSHPTDERVAGALGRLPRREALEVATLSPESEDDVFVLASAVYHGGALASAARRCLRTALAPDDFRHLVVFVSYNRMCHEWMAAHPDVSYELDQRYLRNFGALSSHAPDLDALFRMRTVEEEIARDDRAAVVASQRAGEVTDAVNIAALRLADVVVVLQDRIDRAATSATEKDLVVDELRQTVAFAREILAIVSHDLRNPLNNIAMGTQMALALAPDDRIARPLRRVLSSARRAERILYDLLDFSQVRATGSIRIHPRLGNLATLVRSTMEDLAVTHPGRKVELHVDGDAEGEWDMDRIAQVLSNLVGNALSHGGESSPILIRIVGEHDKVALTVFNENRVGPIPPELLLHIFVPFRRGAADAMSPTRSVGLGLYIVSEIAKAHRGRVEATSTEAGTSFAVHLPRVSTTDGPP